MATCNGQLSQLKYLLHLPYDPTWVIKVGLLWAVCICTSLSAHNIHHAFCAVGTTVEGPFQARQVEACPLRASFVFALLAWHGLVFVSLQTAGLSVFLGKAWVSRSATFRLLRMREVDAIYADMRVSFVRLIACSGKWLKYS